MIRRCAGPAAGLLPTAGSSPAVEAVSVAPLTFAEPKPTVPKSASGKTPPLLDGASAMISADASFACLSRAVVCLVQPRVLLLNVRVNEPLPLAVTVALM